MAGSDAVACSQACDADSTPPHQARKLHGFAMPWEWRAQRRVGGGAVDARPVGSTAPSPESHRSGCDIKGNINSKGERSYHMPGGPDLATTVIDATRGERWFCSEADAQGAGWRPAKQ
jgi:hypothetical protein